VAQTSKVSRPSDTVDWLRLIAWISVLLGAAAAIGLARSGDGAAVSAVVVLMLVWVVALASRLYKELSESNNREEVKQVTAVMLVIAIFILLGWSVGRIVGKSATVATEFALDFVLIVWLIWRSLQDRMRQ